MLYHTFKLATAPFLFLPNQAATNLTYMYTLAVLLLKVATAVLELCEREQARAHARRHQTSAE